MRCPLLTLFIFGSSFGFSQNSYITGSAGYQVGFGKFDSLNYVVDRYNETRPWLDKGMKNFHALDGLY